MWPFKKRRLRPDEITGIYESQAQPIVKSFGSATSRPIDYGHSQRFLLDGLDPLSDARKIVRQYAQIDEGLTSTIQSVVRADTNAEIIRGKKQYFNHVYTLQMILDCQRGELKRAQEKEKVLLADLNDIRAQEEYWNSLLEQYERRSQR